MIDVTLRLTSEGTRILDDDDVPFALFSDMQTLNGNSNQMATTKNTG